MAGRKRKFPSNYIVPEVEYVEPSEAREQRIEQQHQQQLLHDGGPGNPVPPAVQHEVHGEHGANADDRDGRRDPMRDEMVIAGENMIHGVEHSVHVDVDVVVPRDPLENLVRPDHQNNEEDIQPYGPVEIPDENRDEFLDENHDDVGLIDDVIPRHPDEFLLQNPNCKYFVYNLNQKTTAAFLSFRY